MSEEQDVRGDSAAVAIVAEALRAGPGTAAWEEAIALSERAGAGEGGAGEGGGSSVATEFARLAQVRRELAAGRTWREVAAGRGFTEKLMTSIEAGPEAAGGGGGRVLLWIIGLSLLALVGSGLYLLTRLGGDGQGQLVRDERQEEGGLRTVAFASPKLVWDFGLAWPDKTAISGKLPLAIDAQGMRPAAGKVGPAPLGAAAILQTPMMDGVAEVTVQLPQTMAANVAIQIFITDSLDLEPVAATAQQQWLLQIDKLGVKCVTPRLESTAEQAITAEQGITPEAGGKATGGVVIVRLRVEGGRIAASVGAKLVSEGLIGIPADGPRYIGVRFLGRGEINQNVPTVKLLRLLTAK